MKKFLALVLSVVMVASLAACGNSGTKETQAPAASGDSATATESTAAESTGETAEKVGDGVDAKDLRLALSLSVMRMRVIQPLIMPVQRVCRKHLAFLMIRSSSNGTFLKMRHVMMQL